MDVIIKTLHQELSNTLLSETIDVLSSLFQEKHVPIFMSTARNLIKELRQVCG